MESSRMILGIANSKNAHCEFRARSRKSINSVPPSLKKLSSTSTWMLARVPLMTTALWRSLVDDPIKGSVTGDIGELLKHREKYNFRVECGY